MRARPRNRDISLLQRFLRMGASTADRISQPAESIPELPNHELTVKLHRSGRRKVLRCASVRNSGFAKVCRYSSSGVKIGPWLKNSPVACAEMHSESYRVCFETRATNSSNFESKSFRMGDWFDFL